MTEQAEHGPGDDSRLLREIESGSTRAFERLYDRYYARAYRAARSICDDARNAEEAVQQAFMSVWRLPTAYEPQSGGVATWLLAIVRHRAIALARGDSSHRRRHGDQQKTSAQRPRLGDVADRAMPDGDVTRLNASLARLPNEQQEVIGLAFYGRLTHTEIASRLNLPPDTIKGRMRLGMPRLDEAGDELLKTARWRAALAFAFYAGELDHARRIVRDASEDMPAASVLDDVLAPAMHDIGDLWQRREITVADEHLATAVSHRLLAEIATALQVAPPKTRETVLLATPPREQHTFGLLMANDVLFGAGYHTVMLGAGVPHSALSDALVRHQPAVVALSSSMRFKDSLAATASIVQRAAPGTQLVTGGAAARAISSEISAHYVERIDSLLGAVDAVLKSRRALPADRAEESSQPTVQRPGPMPQ